MSFGRNTAARLLSMLFFTFNTSICFSQAAQMRVANGDLTSYDISNFCWSSYYSDDDPHAAVSALETSPALSGGVNQFIVGQYYVELSGQGNIPTSCVYRLRSFEFSSDLTFRSRPISFQDFYRLRKANLSRKVNSRPKESNLLNISTQEIGGCLLSIPWIKFEGREIAAFLISSETSSFVGPVPADVNANDCKAWESGVMQSRVAADAFQITRMPDKKFFLGLLQHRIGLLTDHLNGTQVIRNKDGAIQYVVVVERPAFKKIETEIQKIASNDEKSDEEIEPLWSASKACDQIARKILSLGER